MASSALVTCVGVSSFVATAAILIFADTAYYRGGKALVDALNDPLNNMFNNVVVAPLNSLRYNADVANLATHGLHPRGTHLALNAPMMFGPLAFFAYAAVLRSLFSSAFTSRKRRGGRLSDDHRISIHLHAKRPAPRGRLNGARRVSARAPPSDDGTDARCGFARFCTWVSSPSRRTRNRGFYSHSSSR